MVRKFCQMCGFSDELHSKQPPYSTMMHLAIENHNLDSLKILMINAQDEVNEGDGYGLTPIYAAITTNRTDMVKAIVKHQYFQEEIRAPDGKTPVIFAATYSTSKMVKLLISLGLKHEGYDASGTGLLAAAIMRNNTEIVREALRLGIFADELIDTRRGTVGLMYACNAGFSEITHLLLEAGANARRRDDTGNTANKMGSLCAIHYAAAGGHADCIDTLLDYGAEVNEWAPRGLNALMIAVNKNQTEAALTLIKRGGNVNTRDMNGWTPLLIAAKNGNNKILRGLLKAGASPNAVGRTFTATSLYQTVVVGDINCVTTLLEFEANPNIRDKNGNTPASVAASLNRKDLLKLLIKHNATLDTTYLRAPFPDVNTDMNIGEGMGGEGGGEGRDRLGYGFSVTYSDEEDVFEDGDDNFFDTEGENDRDTIKPEEKPQEKTRYKLGQTLALKATPLIEAIWQDRMKIAECMLKHGAASPNYRPTGEENVSPLHVAVRQNSPDMCRLLLKYGADKDFCGPDPRALSPMALAVRLDRMECVSVLLEAGANVEKDLGIQKKGTLLSLIKTRRAKAVKLLLNLGVDPNVATQHAVKSLHAGPSAETVVVTTMESGPNGTNITKEHHMVAASQNRSGFVAEIWAPPVFVAVNSLINASTPEEESASLEILNMLLEAGANIDDKCFQSDSNALFVAVKANHKLVVKTLLDKGAQPTVRRSDGTMALHVAALSGSEEIFKMLLDHGADPNATMAKGITIPYIAAQEGRVEILRLVRDLGVPLFRTSVTGANSLHMAISSGSTETVQFLLDAGADPNALVEGNSPLLIAVQAGYPEIVKLLLKLGADADFANPSEVTPLHIAIHKGNHEMIRILTSHGAHPSKPRPDGGTPLFHAVANRDAEAIIALVEGGADVNQPGGDGDLAIMLAAEENDTSIVTTLLENGANPNQRRRIDGGVAIMMAVQHRNMDMIDVLLKHSADPSIQSLKGDSGLIIACTQNMTRIALRLISAGAELNVLASNGASPLIGAVQFDNDILVSALIHAGADVEFANSEGLNAMIAAVKFRSQKCFNPLLRARADVNKRDADGISACRYAILNNYTYGLRFLLSNGASPNDRGLEGETLLKTASYHSDISIVQTLLEFKANPNIVDDDDVAPLHVACQLGRLDVVRALLKAGANPNKIACNGYAPIHSVLVQPGGALMELLVKEGKADINILSKDDNDPNTALYIAVHENDYDHAETLLRLGADWSIPNSLGLTPLGNAAWQGHVRMVELLLRYGADVNQKASEGATPLLIAIQRQQNQILEILFHHGAKVDIPDNQGWTPLMYAARMGFRGVAADLLERGADINQRTALGASAAHCAAYSRNQAMLDFLVQEGADTLALDLQGRTPYELIMGASETDAASMSDAAASNLNSRLPSAAELEPTMSNMHGNRDVAELDRIGFVEIDP
ncbi:hypothetical protein AAMO2058_000448200 [Amorphochlora amoebiformis]